MAGRPRWGTVALALAFAAPLWLGGCGDDDDGDVEAFCALADRVRVEALFDDLDPADVEGSLATFREARAAEARLADLAPGPVRDDVEVLIQFLDDLIAGLEDERGEVTDRPSVYDELRPRFDEVEAAGDRLALYTRTRCPETTPVTDG